MRHTLLLSAVIASAALAACERQPPTVVTVPQPVAVPGPPGPAGPAGATGATGATGEPGKTGDTVVVLPPAPAASN